MPRSRRSAPRALPASTPSPGRLDPERRRQGDHLQGWRRASGREPAHGSSIIQDQVSAGPPPPQQQHRHRRQRQLDGVSGDCNLGDVLTAVDLATGVQSVKSTSASGVATLQTASGQTNSSVNASRPAQALDRRQCRPVGHRDRQCAVRVGSCRQHRNGDGVHRRPPVGYRRHQRQDLDLLLLQRRRGGQRHLRRRHQRHGQDAEPAQCGAGSQQPERDASTPTAS